jgi:hypothetical protein
MTTTSGTPKDDRTLAAFTEVTRDSVKPRTEAELDQGLNALFARITVGKAHRREFARWSLVGATTVLCILVGLLIVSVAHRRLPPPAPPALAYQIEGGSVLEGGYLRESSHDGIKLLFNEGTKFELMPGTRARLREVTKAGARVAIEHGTASFQVTPSMDRRWLVEVGPFLVEVKGTVFTVSWDASSERFELKLRHGRVVVSGPVSGGDIVLQAGQRLVVNLPTAETLITEDRPEESAGAVVAASASPAATSPTVRPSLRADTAPGWNTGPTASTVANAHGTRRWADELASGHWDRILEDVERAGIKATLDKASSEDLFALADAARYRRRTDWARAALVAERRRFPSSPRSLDAIFLLGRVDESADRGLAQAIAWYDEYLARAPSGAYAAEALGRKMTLTSELEGQSQARPVAEEYLRRFPKGSYARLAHALSRAP